MSDKEMTAKKRAITNPETQEIEYWEETTEIRNTRNMQDDSNLGNSFD
jgi:hypothetical protein